MKNLPGASDIADRRINKRLYMAAAHDVKAKNCPMHDEPEERG
jgi:hypothetical protein